MRVAVLYAIAVHLVAVITTAAARPSITARPITTARTTKSVRSSISVPPITIAPLHLSQQPLADPPNQPNNHSEYTALGLYNAAGRGDLVYVKTALTARVDPQWQNPADLGTTALYEAARNNHSAVVKVLLDNGVDKNIKDNWGRTPIYGASWGDSVDALTTLISHGADVDIPNTLEGGTPVMIAVQGGHLHALQELIKANANINTTTTDGSTALMYAAQIGHLPVVQELISANANINAAGGLYGDTALHLAAYSYHQAVALLLLENGASNIKLNKDWETPGDVARGRGYVALGNLIDTYTNNNS